MRAHRLQSRSVASSAHRRAGHGALEHADAPLPALRGAPGPLTQSSARPGRSEASVVIVSLQTESGCRSSGLAFPSPIADKHEIIAVRRLLTRWRSLRGVKGGHSLARLGLTELGSSQPGLCLSASATPRHNFDISQSSERLSRSPSMMRQRTIFNNLLGLTQNRSDRSGLPSRVCQLRS